MIRIFLMIALMLMVACSSKDKEQSSSAATEASQSGENEEIELDDDVQSDEKLRPKVNYSALEQAVQDDSHTRILSESTKLLAINKNDVRAIAAMARSYFNRKKYSMTETLLARAFEVQPDNPKFYNMLGLIYLERGEQGRAITAFKKAEVSEMGNREVAMNLGTIYAQYGDYDKAAIRYSKLVVEEIEDPQVLNNVAVTFWRTSNIEKAKEAFDLLVSKKKRPEYMYNYASFLVDSKIDLSKADAQLKELASMSIGRGLKNKVNILKKKVTRRLAKVGEKK